MIPQTLFDALSKVDNDAQATSAMSATVGSDRTAVDMAQGKLTADSSQLNTLQTQQAVDLQAAQDLLTQLYGNPAPSAVPMTARRIPSTCKEERHEFQYLGAVIPERVVRQAAAMGISPSQLLQLLEQLLPLIGPIFNPTPSH